MWIYRKSLAEYRNLMYPPTSLEHAYTNLFNLACHSIVIPAKVLHAKGSKMGLRSSYKDGWISTAIALKYQRMAIFDILGPFQVTNCRPISRDLYD